MDWDAVIERNREVLKRVVAALLAMAEAGCRGQFTFFPQGGATPQGMARVEESKRSPAPTLPRHLHRAVLRLLRPAEAAARRLVIVAARGLVVELPRSRPRKPKPKSALPVLRSLGIAVVMSPADFARVAAEKRAAGKRAAARAAQAPVLPLFDQPRYPFRDRRRTVAPHAAPRIISFNGAPLHRLPPPPAPDDLVDATCLGRRLAALASALEDLPKHARRFARWKLRRDRGLIRRVSPLRPGRPPGQSAATRRRPAHEIHEVLSDLQYFAFRALARPDTS